MGKPTICICETKGADQLRGKLISAFVFATRIEQFLLYLTPKFQVSSLLLCLYRPVCVGPVRKPHCWFSQEAAHIWIFWGEKIRKGREKTSATNGLYRDYGVYLSVTNCNKTKS